MLTGFLCTTVYFTGMYFGFKCGMFYVESNYKEHPFIYLKTLLRKI